MTSEAHRLESVRAEEIDERSGASGCISKSPPPVAPAPQIKPSRRCSEGDIFLRCKPRSQAPPVALKQRRVSHAALPTLPETLGSVLEGTSNFAPFGAKGTAADAAIFSSFPAAPQQSPLDDIITALEKICDEFTLPERADDSQQRGNDDVFENALLADRFFNPANSARDRRLVSAQEPLARSASTCSDTYRRSSGGFLKHFQSKTCCAKEPTNGKCKPNETAPFGSLLDLNLEESTPSRNADANIRKASVAFKPEIPAVLTAPNGGKRGSSPSEELEIVKSILANLDFDKYKRRLSLDDMEEKSPPRTHKSSSAKFKDLFDLLKPSTDTSNKRPFVLRRSSSFSNAEDTEAQIQTLPEASKKMATLPRRKSPIHQPLRQDVSSCPSIRKTESEKRLRKPEGRSLTYPPQRKTSVEPTDVSESQYLSVDGKPHKKKHHSDPGGETCSPGFMVGASRSEPELGGNEETPQHSDDYIHLKLVIDVPRVAATTSRFGVECHPASKSPQEQRRYSKRRLRGPYGEMLEEEMRKSGEKQKSAYSDLSFLQESKNQEGDDAPHRPAMFLSSQSLDDASSTSSRNELSMCVTPKRKISANYPLQTESDPPRPPIPKESRAQDRHLDTRTHVVCEILETEKSYVESLQTLVTKYMVALKSTDYNGVVEGGIVDEIFFQIPEILSIHEDFLESLSQRCINWDAKYTVGDLFVEAFTKQQVIDTYTAFINNWKCAKDATKIATQAKPAFARFLEVGNSKTWLKKIFKYMSREHKGKLALDALLIMPVQRIPRYELLLKELLKHTNMDHPDHHHLVQAQKEVHDLAVKINRVEREAFQLEQMQQRVREIEQHIEGVIDLCMPDRAFIRHDVVTIPGGLGTKKERCLFLFSDVLLITSIKRKSTAMRKPSSTPPSTSQSPFSVLDSNKYKLLTRFSLESMEISKSTDVSLKKAMRDIAILEEDIHILNQIKELIGKLKCNHQSLEDAVRDLTNSVSKQMLEKQNNDYSLISLEMTVTTQERVENLTIQFTSPERRAVWSAAFNEAKQKLALSTGRRPPPELKKAMPIRKTRAGLQFTCATATLGFNQQGLREVWVCNSDGYVGQVCVLSLLPEPTVMSCNGVCNARILTIASIPATCTMINDKTRWRTSVPDNTPGVSIEVEEVEENVEDVANNGNIQLDSDSSDEDDDTESADDEKSKDENRKRGSSIPREEGLDDMDNKQPTMWLGTEDGCILVYNCNDNIRIKKNKIKIQHECAIQCVIYLDNRVFVSIANGEVHIYKKETEDGWGTCEPQKVIIGSSSAPVTTMLAVAGKLWCGCQNSIHVLNTGTLQVEHSFAVSTDTTRNILCMVTSGLGVWATVTPSAIIRLFHATSYEPLLDVNVAPTVAKILSAATDDIIKQHKSACLRVTAMLACKDLLWLGTSAGVILTLPLPHLTSTTTSVDNIPTISGLPHGHTGHVRFLTSVEISSSTTIDPAAHSKHSFRSSKCKEGTSGRRASTTTAASAGSKLLVISGGDGYEDFQTSGLGEQAGHDDSTNHLLLWHV